MYSQQQNKDQRLSGTGLRSDEQGLGTFQQGLDTTTGPFLNITSTVATEETMPGAGLVDQAINANFNEMSLQDKSPGAELGLSSGQGLSGRQGASTGISSQGFNSANQSSTSAPLGTGASLREGLGQINAQQASRTAGELGGNVSSSQPRSSDSFEFQTGPASNPAGTGVGTTGGLGNQQQGQTIAQRAAQIPSKAATAASQTATTAKDYATSGAQRVAQIPSQAATAASQTATTAKDYATSGAQRVAQIPSQAANAASQTATTAKDYATSGAATARDYAASGATTAMEYAQAGAQKAAQAGQAAVDTAVSAKDRVLGTGTGTTARTGTTTGQTGYGSGRTEAPLSSVHNIGGQDTTRGAYNSGHTETMAQKAVNMKDAALQKGSELSQSAYDTAVTAKDKVLGTGTGATDSSSKTWPASTYGTSSPQSTETLGQKAVNMKDAALQKGSELSQSAYETAVAAKDSVLGTNAGQQAVQTKDAAMQKGSEWTQGAKQGAQDLGSGVRDTTSSYSAHETQPQAPASSYLGSAMHAVSGLANTVASGAVAAKDAVLGKAEDVKESAATGGSVTPASRGYDTSSMLQHDTITGGQGFDSLGGGPRQSNTPLGSDYSTGTRRPEDVKGMLDQKLGGGVTQTSTNTTATGQPITAKVASAAGSVAGAVTGAAQVAGQAVGSGAQMVKEKLAGHADQPATRDVSAPEQQAGFLGKVAGAATAVTGAAVGTVAGTASAIKEKVWGASPTEESAMHKSSVAGNTGVTPESTWSKHTSADDALRSTPAGTGEWEQSPSLLGRVHNIVHSEHSKNL